MSTETTIKVPNIGGADQVDVIEVLVHPGDVIQKETPLITLESDKASMEIPSPKEGTVKAIQVKVGDKVSEGSVILTLVEETSTGETKEKSSESRAQKEDAKEKNESQEGDSSTEVKTEQTSKADQTKYSSEPTEEQSLKQSQASKSAAAAEKPTADEISQQADDRIYAGPGVRRMARELGVNLAEIKGSGPKERITKEDLQQGVKKKLAEKSNGGWNTPAMPPVDFSQFGSIEVKPLSKIKKLTGINVHRAWLTIPHVTQFDEADITELEAFRKSEANHEELQGQRLTLLAFVTKVVCKALTRFPQFNASLDPTGEKLIYKNYYHIGIAVETPNGLVAPVLRDVDQLSIRDIAIQMGKISVKAREKGLMPNEMSGGCFTISSLGGIGGTAFTPIVNSPEVAILGLSRSTIKPVFINGEFQPRLMLPLSLSYDHRVIDGAEAARFSRFIAESLEDLRRILL